MSKFTSEMVDKYANLLLIGLTPEENKMVLDEFEIIDKNMELITKIPNISDVEPKTHGLDNIEFELREDNYEESLPINDLLSNTDSKKDRYIVVPKVVS